ncbi:Penicillin-binding protein 2D [Streptomyces sp. RB5]|uniref:Penicillin-binding protein 2D n=1 Tax=Streptomyces smaragdinus TaxID=2585196 RepID=A0A7K0CQE4_9ACTN|nr:transglycosylase domain-containing protein [Streptomyces smaragdinus]MQY14974.1 Penicillin-binding protein 2D [Streptomyces smaragdinus]
MAYKRPGGGLTTAQQAAKFLGVSLLAGALLAGISLPAVGALGLAAKGTVEGFDKLPASIERPPLSQRNVILDRDGGLIATVYERNRTVIPIKQVAPVMQQAIVAIEDARYYQHGAVDLKGILRALNANAQAGTVQEGASTLTQQYVKNIAMEEAGESPEKLKEATRQTLGRKIKELKLAIQVEQELTKKEILEGYLNIAFFGEQAYGVEAAAQRYYSKPASKLKLTEAAMLAGIVQSPSRYDPVNDEREALKRRNDVIDRMAKSKYISAAEAEKAKAEDLGLKFSSPRNGCITAVQGAGHFCDYVRRTFLGSKLYGKTEGERQKRWNQGGLTIRTTLDPKAQKSLNDSVKKHVFQKDKVATAVSMVEPGTGKIIGMGQSRPYGLDPNKHQTEINLSVDHSMGGSTYGFQTGSTFKPFTAAAALEEGIPNSKVYPAPNKMLYPERVETCDPDKPSLRGIDPETGGPESVQNETKSEVGPYALKEATAKSINTYFVAMIAEIGICPVKTLAQNMGVHRGDGKELQESTSLTLGTQTIAPLTMANAYATFANRGEYCTPVAIESVKDADNKSLPVPKTQCKRVMDEKTADTVNTLLNGVVTDGTGAQAGLSGRASAGKTGTTDNRKAAWFVGYTPNLAAAVWVGGAGGKDVEMVNINIGGVYYPKVFGGGVPGPIWRDAMSGAVANRPAESFNLVPIANPKPKHKDRPGHGDDDPLGGLTLGGITGGDTGGPTDPTNGGTLDGGTLDGGTLDGGTTDAGTLIGGGNGNGNGNTTGWP